MLAFMQDKLSVLRHKNICRWYLLTSTEPTPAVGMTWFAYGNVLDFTNRNPGVDRFEIVCMVFTVDDSMFILMIQVKQMASAVEYIHTLDHIHGNIVPVCAKILDSRPPHDLKFIWARPIS